MTDATFGQLLALTSAFLFAASGACISRSTMKLGDRGVMFSVLVTIVFSAVLWLAIEGPDLSGVMTPQGWRGLAWFAFAGLCAMVLGRSFQYVSLRKLGVTRSSATKRLNPFFSVAIAAMVLAEPVSAIAAGGMAVTALAFYLLIRAGAGRATAGVVPRLMDYSWGVGSALAYAGAYITRKIGLIDLPSPALGTLVSALTGMAIFLALALVNARQRASLVGVFRYLDRWNIAAAVLMSLGQIVLFWALLYERVSVIVMIASLEVFIASFLSVVVLKTEARPDLATYVAAGLGTLGVILIASG
ncbi:DMT family transporter [Fertoebacter nigrum]|uniref:DMT family transporter n=1 Tax=Fertoeibacter niger TaxID=2656921 RepID=A0A8X8H1H5_9RHOB|nr:DMT family transporter [Fertoeibacter niger]NUB45853.1 DMT family transporter [Fertoeibacter niger]